MPFFIANRLKIKKSILDQKYKQTLDFLFRQLPMFQRVGQAAFKKDLSRTLAMDKILEHPHKKYPTIHVGGTNGKGSTSHIIAGILQAKGLKVGMYTSPHYRDFRERIKINGTLISQEKVVDFVEKNQSSFAEIQPSFFEWTVALAFDYFADQKVDVAVIEVGLGGRFDSTNIITPLVSAITNISLDHTQFLGETLPEIAFEKAGIIKPNIPIVIGEKQTETSPVFLAKANKENAPLTFAEEEFRVELKRIEAEHQVFDVFKSNKLIISELRLNLLGDFQAKNLITALATFEKVSDVLKVSDTLDSEVLADLRSKTHFLGRRQNLGEKPRIIADSAHNEGGLKLTMAELQKMKFEKLHFVLGAVADKNIDKMLSLLPKDAKYYFAKANIPRGLDALELKKRAANFGLKGRKYLSVKNALRAAKRHANEEDLIYIGGSTFVVAEVV